MVHQLGCHIRQPFLRKAQPSHVRAPMTNEATKVYLHVYDLSNGLAASLSPSLLGKKVRQEETCDQRTPNLLTDDDVTFGTDRRHLAHFHRGQSNRVLLWRRHLFGTGRHNGLWSSSPSPRTRVSLAHFQQWSHFLHVCEHRETHLPVDVIHDLIEDLRHRFSECSYNLLSNNCNNFSDELAKLLLGKGIPVSPLL